MKNRIVNASSGQLNTTFFYTIREMMHFAIITLLLGTISSCNLIEIKNDPITYGETYIEYLMRTDKACYQPGDIVKFNLNNMPENGAIVRYQHLGKIIKEERITSLQWTWQPPADDFRGYMAELHTHIEGNDTVVSSIAIDVSSEPSRFPRNGFLSTYGNMSQREIDLVMDDLNRYHINYVQFQDWHWKHHHPLGGSATQPMEVWTDIISRNCYRSTVQGYIDAAHKRGMQTLFYNLGYGVLEDYESDGVSKEWLLYTDKQHRVPDFHPLTSPFKSSIYLANTANIEWKEYLADRNDEVYTVFNFDGWQIDQLGDRKVPLYDYNGNTVNLVASFGPFIQHMKEQQPNKRLVMNAVGQYGQEKQIASSAVDFCYSEVWQHSNSGGYDIFRDIITNNAEWSDGKQTVLAAYLNYDYGKKGRGYFNTPGIIMATAVATAWGGTILQMGEHMLCNEYFPNNNLAMSGELKRAMISYYDFAVGYENLLRPDIPDSGINSDWFGVDISCTNDSVIFNQWAPQRNKIATIGRHIETLNVDVIHMLSYRNATHLDWCDSDGDQGEPDNLYNLVISIASDKQPNRIWVASPDYQHGAAIELNDYRYSDGNVHLTLPALKYYTMLIFEY